MVHLWVARFSNFAGSFLAAIFSLCRGNLKNINPAHSVIPASGPYLFVTEVHQMQMGQFLSNGVTALAALADGISINMLFIPHSLLPQLSSPV